MKTNQKIQASSTNVSIHVQRLVLTALMAALTYIATSIIKIPSPMTGYIHPGDGIVFLTGILLGPLYGGLSAGIGSMMADILGGYPHYAPGTFLIKAVAAIACYFVYTALKKFLSFSRKKKHLTILSQVIPATFGGIAGGIIVVIGYFLYASLYLGKGLAAASSIPGNIVQAVFGTITVSILLPLLVSTPFIRDIMLQTKSSDKKTA